mmetsp:Transcript_44963/g.98238  ORF Transcript_44963/g.98238 Transcript_44963/m.98238 type:complete len:162 (+) Transcript_44963:534-1019(+)
MKRRHFSRFFFLSDESLLEILAKTKDPTRVQPHLNKCFEAIDKVVFESGNVITFMISPEGEKVRFMQPVKPDEGEFKGNVEKWMKDLEIKMKKTMKELSFKSMQDFAAKPFLDWIKAWPAMNVIANDSYNWTMQTEKALKEMSADKLSMTKFKDSLQEGIL